MAILELTFESDVLATLQLSPSEAEREVRLAAAIRWYAQGRLSQGKAAEVARVSRAEFIDAVSASGLPVIQLTAEELRAELAGGEGERPCRRRLSSDPSHTFRPLRAPFCPPPSSTASRRGQALPPTAGGCRAGMAGSDGFRAIDG